MSFSVRATEEAGEDLIRLYAFAAENDPAAADRALKMIGKTWEMLEEFPFSCRKAEDAGPFLR
ncbi:MAG: type II toxin-antitoxin system RelE/ParE family toxin, partial [Chromatocurvus sp.]